LEAESKRNGVRHKIVLMDGSEIERKLTLIEAGVLRRLALACHVTGQLFDPDDGHCLSSTRIFARSA
jgi:nitrite reductase/ring-hydroxylating ferredoxin subunit